MPLIRTHPHLRHESARASHVSHLNDTYLSERAQARKDTATNPGGVFALRGCRNPDLHILDRESFDLSHQSVWEVLAQCRPAREHNVEV